MHKASGCHLWVEPSSRPKKSRIFGHLDPPDSNYSRVALHPVHYQLLRKTSFWHRTEVVQTDLTCSKRKSHFLIYYLCMLTISGFLNFF